ncbi:hypothetical protein U1Q18_038778 [Sarracenia purpurea var. burkii]
MVRLLIGSFIADKSKLGDDDNCKLRTIIRACLDVIASLTRDCIESIHRIENKRHISCKMLQMKLSFALEHVSSLAKLAYEIEYLGENRENDLILFAVIRRCTKCIQTVLVDTNILVLSLGLQMLKSMVQRSTSSESNSFLLFFSGELLKDVFNLIDMMLRKPVSREAASIVGECLRILVILQTLSKSSECQKGLMSLLLEAIVMVFSAPDDDLSLELNDLRNMARKLVSQLAQIPSSAVYLKDILLALPVANRQQLQGIIRASVSQEHAATQMKSTMPSLVIKLPVQTEESTQKGPTTSSPTKHIDNSSEEEEDDDDWDAFQSFPASKSEEVMLSLKVETATKEEPALFEKSSISDFNNGKSDLRDHASSWSPNNADEVTNADQQAVDQREMISEHHHGPVPSPDDRSLPGLDSVEVAEGFIEPRDDHFDEKSPTSTGHENRLTSESVELAEGCTEPVGDRHQVVSDKDSNLALSDLQSIEDTKRSVQLNISGNKEEESERSPGKINDLPGTSRLSHPQAFSGSNDSVLALSDLQSVQDTERSVQLNISGDDKDDESERSPGRVNDLPGSSGSLLPNTFSEFKHPRETDDGGRHRESNLEGDGDARNEIKS